MTSSRLKQIFGLLLLTFYIPFGWASDRPNVVLMLSDNLGYGDLGAYGGGDTADQNEVLGGNDGSFAPAAPQQQQQQGVQNPADLLPKNSNSDFSPNSANVNNDGLLSAGHHVGVGGSDAPLRNTNMQLRSEEPNPRTNTGPWNQSTIEADSTRRGIC